MGRKFDVEYADFSGGHFVGAYDVAQPMNTFTGANVAVTADQGFLMPDQGWRPLKFSNDGTTFGSPFVDLFGECVVSSVVSFGVERLYRGRPAGVSQTSTFSATNVFSQGQRQSPVVDGYEYASIYAGRLHQRNFGGTLTRDIALPFGNAEGVWQWGVFTLSVHSTQPILYWSNAGDISTWAATNFLRLGQSWSSIKAVVPTAEVLYVATTEGWYAVTGVLGETTSVRKVSVLGISNADGVPSSLYTSTLYHTAVHTPAGILFMAGQRGVRVNQGSNIVDFARFPSAPQITNMVSAGDHVVVTTGNPQQVWIWSYTRRTWRMSTLPNAAQYGYLDWTRVIPAFDEGNASKYMYLAATGRKSVTVGDSDLVMLLQLKEPTNPSTLNDSFVQGVADLAGFEARQPFRVSELLVEVDFGSTVLSEVAPIYVGDPPVATALNNAPRSLGAQIVTGPVADIDATLARDSAGSPTFPTSSLLTKTWANLGTTIAGDREMVRFRPSDAGASFTASPRLTMRGVKVRRVIMRCEEV